MSLGKRVKNRLVGAAEPPPYDTRSVTTSKAEQLWLSLRYRELLQSDLPLPKLTDVGFRVHSQCDEDGIILFLFSVLGTASRLFVEIGAGDGIECNCANLAINFGWHGLFVDGDAEHVAHGTGFYERHPDTRLFPPVFVTGMVTKDNVNGVLSDAGFKGEIDLLSIDIDGMDYWIWEAVECVDPRVVVIEANAKLGMRSIAVPYDPGWTYDADAHPHYHGASLPAMVNLAHGKGYRLVGTNRFGFNAFFVKDDIAADVLPAVTIESCRMHPTRQNDERCFEKISHLPYVGI